MTETTTPAPDATAGDDVVGGGAPAPAPVDPQAIALARAVEHLELLSPEAREAVLNRMDPARAEQLRQRLTSMPDRPHGQFSTDVAERRRLLREMSERIHARNTKERAEEAENLAMHAATPPAPISPMPHPAPRAAGPPSQPGMPGHTPAAMVPAGDPLDALRVLHPAAIARAMQGERAEAWAIVLDRLDVNARAALQLYLDPTAQAAIDDARRRQADLKQTAPALLDTVEAAIARTVVPRAMREHHQLLSTTPLTWSADGGGATYQ